MEYRLGCPTEVDSRIRDMMIHLAQVAMTHVEPCQAARTAAVQRVSVPCAVAKSEMAKRKATGQAADAQGDAARPMPPKVPAKPRPPMSNVLPPGRVPGSGKRRLEVQEPPLLAPRTPLQPGRIVREMPLLPKQPWYRPPVRLQRPRLEPEHE